MVRINNYFVYLFIIALLAVGVSAQAGNTLCAEVDVCNDSLPQSEVEKIVLTPEEIVVQGEMEQQEAGTEGESASLSHLSLSVPDDEKTSSESYQPHRGMDWRMFKSVTNPATKPYTFWQDQTWVGIPVFFAGLIAKGEKEAFRQNYKNPNTKIRLIKYNFHSEIDNYTQYVPLALTIGLHLGGVEGRSDWPRFWASSAMSAAIMAGLVNGIKYTASEMRPDGSTRNPWPSGHTATAFMAATILHKEYGLTRSPWYSVGAYTLATATGVMRVLNNRHWISDVLSGAGIGILSVELGYGICDLLFKGRGLLRNDLSFYPDLRANPSFFSISMGIGLGNRNLTLPGIEYNFPKELVEDQSESVSPPLELKFRMATAVGAEAAYFFNPYVGVGGRLRVKSTPINGWSAFAMSDHADLKEFLSDPSMANTIQNIQLTIESDHITEFAGDAGVYFSLPLSSRFALGSKLLVGRSIMDDIDVNAAYDGQQLQFNIDGLDDPNAQMFTPTGAMVSSKWDYINVSASNSMKFGTGISLTYAHRNSFSWRVFCDYDFSRKTFKAEYNPLYFLKDLSPDMADLLNTLGVDVTQSFTSSMRKSLHQWVLGCALCVSF